MTTEKELSAAAVAAAHLMLATALSKHADCLAINCSCCRARCCRRSSSAFPAAVYLRQTGLDDDEASR